MSEAAIFQASVHGLRTVGGRKCIQIVLEAPIEQQAEIARICEHDAWVAVTRLDPVAVEETNKKRKWADLSPQAQAGTLCNDPEFIEYLGAVNSEGAAILVRQRCNVSSRSELSTNNRASREWASIVNDFRVWQQARP